MSTISLQPTECPSLSPDYVVYETMSLALG